MSFISPEDITAAEEGARRQRARARSIYSVLFPVSHLSAFRQFEILDRLSEAVERIEKHGWMLNQMNCYATDSESNALLLFRATDS